MTELYDVFLEHSHTPLQEKLLLNFNYHIVDYIVKKLNAKNKKTIEILEIGVGKGYFTKSCFEYNKTHDKKINYSALDRNGAMLENVKKYNKSIKTYQGELQKLTIKPKNKFDIIYCAFVVEHLKNGQEIYELITNVKKILNDGGLIIFLTPNALNQKYEFFNIDYTHQYPTTARNVSMAFYDSGINDVTCLKFNGLCTYKHFYNPVLRIMHKAVFSLYSYRLFAFLARPFYRVPLYRLNNFFYQAYCFFKEENLMFIARKKG